MVSNLWLSYSWLIESMIGESRNIFVRLITLLAKALSMVLQFPVNIKSPTIPMHHNFHDRNLLVVKAHALRWARPSGSIEAHS
jgi:hypothetical protein